MPKVTCRRARRRSAIVDYDKPTPALTLTLTPASLPPLHLLAWSNKWRNILLENKNTQNIISAMSEIRKARKFIFNEKIGNINIQRTLSVGVYICTIYDDNNTTELEFEIIIKNSTGYINKFAPYSGIYVFLPNELMIIVDLLCAGLAITSIALKDAAKVYMCQQKIRIKDIGSIGVPLSAILLIKTGKSYYERFGFTPISEDAEYKQELQTKINPPANIRTFLEIDDKVHVAHVHVHDLLKKCLLKYEEMKCVVPGDVLQWIESKIKTLDIPDVYIKRYVYRTHD